MIIKRPIRTEKQKQRDKVNAKRKEEREARLDNWHPKFVIFKKWTDYATCDRFTVWFETIERKRWSAKDGNWFKYRIPQNVQESPAIQTK